MSTDGFRLLICSTPLWQNPAANHPLPVHVRTVYTVMGRNGPRWRTVLSSTEDIDIARVAMDAANQSGEFDRLVIATGKSVNRAPASNWVTIECALPYPASDFQKLFARLEAESANLNPAQKLAQMPHAYLIGHRKSQRFLLALAVVLATFDKNVPALWVVAALAMFDTLFLMDARPLTQRHAHILNTGRNWLYALVNGYLLYQLLV